MISFAKIKKAIPIAYIEDKDGPNNKKKIYLIPDEVYKNLSDRKKIKISNFSNPDDYINDKKIKEYLKILGNKKISTNHMRQFKLLFKNSHNSEYDEIKNNMKKHIKINSGVIVPYPHPKKCQRLLIGGPSESGKSYYCSKYIKLYKKMFPKNPRILLSDVPKDHVLDKHNMLRIQLNDELIENPIEPNEFNNSLIMFDDVDAITSNKLSKVVNKTRDYMLTRGRHENLSIICTTHAICDGEKTKVMLRECTHFTIFPRAGLAGLEYLLKKYIGLGKTQIKQIFNLPSRWVTICKVYPMHVLYEGGVFLL